MRRGMSAEEADDHISEHGVGVSLQQANDMDEDRERERAENDGRTWPPRDELLPNSTTGGQCFD